MIRNTLRNDDGTYDVEVLVTDGRGGAAVAGRITHAFTATTRVDPSRRIVYLARSDQGARNAYAFSIDSGTLTALTQNRLPGVTFSGFQPLGTHGVIGVREERRDDIWLIQQVDPARTGNQAGR